MALKGNWIDKVDGVDYVLAKDINDIAHSVMDVEEAIENMPENGGGSAGKDGVTFTPQVSSAGIISWTNNGGLDNPTPVNIKGPKGDPYTLTEDDKAEIVAQIGQIEAPKIVSSVDEMTDTTKHYVLQSTGTIWANKTGTTTTVTENNEYDSSYTTGLNLRLSTNDGTHRTGATGRYTTDYISITPTTPYTVTVKGLSTALVTVDDSYYIVHYFGADKSYLGYASMGMLGHSPASGALPMSFDISKYSNFSNAAYVRITLHISTSNITMENCDGLVINFEPKNTVETTTGTAWYDTGISYAPTFKTDLIGVLGENNVIYLSDNALPSGTYTLKYGDENYTTVGTITV